MVLKLQSRIIWNYLELTSKGRDLEKPSVSQFIINVIHHLCTPKADTMFRRAFTGCKISSNKWDGLYEKWKYVAESFNTQLVLDSYSYCLQKGI